MDRITDFSDLPEAFSMRQENGQFIQVKEPCYNLLTAGFYGLKNSGTYYEEGEIIVTDQTPNYHMQPLNRAAGRKTMAWLESLPMSGVSINIDDLSEATSLMAKNPKLAEMTSDQIATATHAVAVQLKKKREGTHGLIIPPIAGDSIETMHQRAGQKPPAMLAAQYSDPTLRGPGMTGNRGIIHTPDTSSGGVKRQAPPMGAQPSR